MNQSTNNQSLIELNQSKKFDWINEIEWRLIGFILIHAGIGWNNIENNITVRG